MEVCSWTHVLAQDFLLTTLHMEGHVNEGQVLSPIDVINNVIDLARGTDFRILI